MQQEPCTIKFIQQIYPLGNKPINDTVNSFEQRHGKFLTILTEENSVCVFFKNFSDPRFSIKD